jgi:hypothetical protein
MRAALLRHDDSALAPSYENDYFVNPSRRLAAMTNKVAKVCGRYAIEVTSSAPVSLCPALLGERCGPVVHACSVAVGMSRGNRVAGRGKRKTRHLPARM